MAGEAVGKSQAKIEPKKMTLEKIMPTFLFLAIAPYRAAVCHGNSFDMPN